MMKPDMVNVVEVSKQTWQQVIREGRKSIMNQYVVYYQDGGTEYVDAYSYTQHRTTFVFDLGHGNFKYCYDVESVEIL